MVELRSTKRKAGRGATARTLGTAGVAATLVLLAAAPASGQEDEEGQPKGFWGNADVGFTLTAGNSETTSLGLSFDLYHERFASRWTVTADYVLSTADGDETANKLDTEARFDYSRGSRAFAFGRMYGGFNKQAGINSRVSPGAGAGYTVVDGEKVTLSFSTGGTVLSERFVSDSTSTSFTLDFGERLTLTIDEDTNITQSVVYTPKVSEFANYLIRAEARLATMFSELLGISLTASYDFRSRPFVDADGEPRKKSDLTLITGLTFAFD